EPFEQTAVVMTSAGRSRGTADVVDRPVAGTTWIPAATACCTAVIVRGDRR
ncbi:MAG: hypothetical protein ACI9CV_002232, partial [Ilumatobacter sp.]